MSGLPIFDIAGSALAAQSIRLNTVASNLANADSVSGDPGTVYRPREAIFVATATDPSNPSLAGVQVDGIVESNTPPLKRYDPGHPLADGQGYIYAPDVDPVAQMVNMISSSRAYQADVEMVNTAQQLALSTLNMGR
jgi:flagellar basal-body rod protein FlgC